MPAILIWKPFSYPTYRTRHIGKNLGSRRDYHCPPLIALDCSGLVKIQSALAVTPLPALAYTINQRVIYGLTYLLAAKTEGKRKLKSKKIGYILTLTSERLQKLVAHLDLLIILPKFLVVVLVFNCSCRSVPFAHCWYPVWQTTKEMCHRRAWIYVEVRLFWQRN